MVIAGFLPPDTDPPNDEGFINDTIQPKASLATGATLYGQASIVFNTNAPIAMPEFVNTVDVTTPTRAVKALGKGKNRKPAMTKPGAPVPVTLAVYPNDQVTLTPRSELTASKAEELIINGSLITDTLGSGIDGADHGTTGSNFIAIITRRRVTAGGIPLARARHRIASVVDVVDHLLAHAELAKPK